MRFMAHRAPDGVVGGAEGNGAAAPPPGAPSAAGSDTAKEANEAGGSNGSVAGANDWYAAFDEDTRKTVEAKGWKSPSDAVKSYNDLFRDYTKKTSNAVVLPGPDAPTEQWEQVYTKLGRPEKADGYEFALPQDLPADLPYDQSLSAQSKEWAFNAGLNPKQAQILHDNFARYQANAYKSMQEQSAQQVEAAHGALTKTWGSEDSPDYQRNVELARRAIRHLGGDDLMQGLKQIDALDASGMVKNPALAIAFAKVGEMNYAEDASWSGGGGTINPFAPGPNENLEEQGKLLKRDPELAKSFMRQAGIDPREYLMK